MRIIARFVLTLLMVPFLAGCFTSQTSLYKGVKPLQPFRDHAVFTDIGKNKGTNIIVREVNPGIYQLTIEDKDVNNNDSGSPYRFFRLPGAPTDTFVGENKSNDCFAHPPNNTRCHSYYLYTLWHMTKARLEVSNPDCSKITGASNLPSVKKSDDGTSCDFASRTTLEKALRMAVAAHLEPENVFTVRQ